MIQHTRHIASCDQRFTRTPLPRELCDTILAVLGRDDTLRLVFLRRRWQGCETTEQRGQ
jgi:hypothetical protein